MDMALLAMLRYVNASACLRLNVHIFYQSFTTHFPRADIHELLSPDLLHQVIKGTFKDHLVDWVAEYLESVHGKTRSKEILADIDRRYVEFTRGFVVLLTVTCLLLLELLQCHCSQVYAVFVKVVGSNSGQVTILRH
jgi:Plavaka transposase